MGKDHSFFQAAEDTTKHHPFAKCDKLAHTLKTLEVQHGVAVWQSWLLIPHFPAKAEQFEDRLNFMNAYLQRALDAPTSRAYWVNTRPDVNGKEGRNRAWLMQKLLRELIQQWPNVSTLTSQGAAELEGRIFDACEDIEELILQQGICFSLKQNDLTRYKTLGELAQKVRTSRFGSPYTKEKLDQLHEKYLNKQNDQGKIHAELIATLPDGTQVVNVHTFEASHAYGSRAWCIATEKEKYYEHFVENLIFIYTPDGERYALHFKYEQCVNSKNFVIPPAYLINQHPGLGEALAPYFEKYCVDKPNFYFMDYASDVPEWEAVLRKKWPKEFEQWDADPAQFAATNLGKFINNLNEWHTFDELNREASASNIKALWTYFTKYPINYTHFWLCKIIKQFPEHYQTVSEGLLKSKYYKINDCAWLLLWQLNPTQFTEKHFQIFLDNLNDNYGAASPSIWLCRFLARDRTLAKRIFNSAPPEFLEYPLRDKLYFALWHADRSGFAKYAYPHLIDQLKNNSFVEPCYWLPRFIDLDTNYVRRILNDLDPQILLEDNVVVIYGKLYTTINESLLETMYPAALDALHKGKFTFNMRRTFAWMINYDNSHAQEILDAIPEQIKLSPKITEFIETLLSYIVPQHSPVVALTDNNIIYRREEPS